jgi:predicted adenylyl cyclase CyaB
MHDGTTGELMEIEVKLALDTATRERLENQLGAPLRTVRQKDTYLKTDPLSVALRVREDGDHAWVTLKAGFEKRDGIRIREELEPAIRPEDVALWLAVFARLGFAAHRVVAKTRKEYQRGEVHVVLDEVEGLGAYAEIEVVGDDADRAQAQLEIVMAELGVGALPRITKSYRDLLEQAGAYEPN